MDCPVAGKGSVDPRRAMPANKGSALPAARYLLGRLLPARRADVVGGRTRQRRRSKRRRSRRKWLATPLATFLGGYQFTPAGRGGSPRLSTDFARRNQPISPS